MMEKTHKPLQSVVIVGGGTAGWMAACALAKLIGPQISIHLVESEEIGIVGVGEATIPAIKLFNQAIGLNETEFLRRTQATFKLGIQFVDWSRLGSRYIHAFGDIGLPLGVTPFHHYWLRARHRFPDLDLWTFSPNAQASAQNRFAHVAQIADTPMAGLAYAFHFDAALYAQYLRSIAEGLGVTRTEGKIQRAEQRESDGFISAIILESGARIEGDLFIDCSGFRGLLIEQTLKTGYEDWSNWLPCDRAIAVPNARVEPLTPYTRSTARAAGWQWRIPLQHRTGNGYVYCSAFLSEDEAIETLLQNLDAPHLAEPRPLRFVTGRREKFWNKNVVALGLASGFMEPLESTSIHLIQSGVIRLITMFPDLSFDPVLIEEYNRQCIIEFERIRDFLVLHYRANAKDDAPFWRMCQNLPVSEALQRKLDLFESSGRIYREADELFTEAAWLQVMIGQGIIPRAHHPIADALGDDQLERYLADLRHLITRTIDRAPDHDAYIDAMLESSAT
jgi:tryptophan halogenase